MYGRGTSGRTHAGPIAGDHGPVVAHIAPHLKIVLVFNKENCLIKLKN